MNSWISNWTKWHISDLGYISYSISQIAGVTTFCNLHKRHKRQVQRRFQTKISFWLVIDTLAMRFHSSNRSSGLMRVFCVIMTAPKRRIPWLSGWCAFHWSHRFILAPVLERNIFDEHFTLASFNSLAHFIKVNLNTRKKINFVCKIEIGGWGFNSNYKTIFPSILNELLIWVNKIGITWMRGVFMPVIE